MATYEQVVVGDAPLAYFHLDSTSGTTETNLGTLGGAGTITGTGFTRGQPSVGTVPGTSFKLPNATAASYVTSDTLTLTDYTFEIWFRKDTAFGGAVTIKLMSLVGASTPEVTIGRNNGYFRLLDGSLNDGPVDAAIIDGNWHHLVVTKAGSAVKWYRDGVQVYTGSSSALTRTNYTARVAGALNSEHSPAWIDEPAFYNRALAPEEVLEHYNTAFAAQAVDVSVAAPVTTSNVDAVDALNKQVSVVFPAVTSSASAVNATVTATDIWHQTITATADDDWADTGTGATANINSSDNATFYIKFNDPRTTGTLFDSMTLRVYQRGTSTLGYQIHRITTPWVEGQATRPTTVATGKTGSFSSTTPGGMLEAALTGTQLNGWNVGNAPFYGLAIIATSGSAQFSTRENTTEPKPTLEYQLVSNAVDINVTAPAATSNAIVRDAVVKTGTKSVATAITSDLTAPSSVVSATKNVDASATIATTSVSAVNADAVIVNPDYAATAPVATSDATAANATVVAGAEIDVAAAPVTSEVEVVAAGFSNQTDVVVESTVAVSSIHGVSTYDRSQDRYMAFVPNTVDLDDVWYQMEETSGTVADNAAATSALDGTYIGSPEFQIEGPYLRKAVRFDGVEDYLTLDFNDSAFFPVMDITIEFSIKTEQQNGTLFTGWDGVNKLLLVNGEMVFVNEFGIQWKVRKNLADGQWHHVVVSLPSTSNSIGIPVPRPFFVLVDGTVQFRRNDGMGVNGARLIPQTAMAFYRASQPLVPATDLVAGEMRDLIVRVNYAVGIDTATKLYYEWSNSVVTSATVATTAVTAVSGLARGNVKKMLAIYGLPYSLNRDNGGGQAMNYYSTFAGFYIDNSMPATGDRQTGSAGFGQYVPVEPFYLNDYLVYPVAITGQEASADGVANGEYIDPSYRYYVDDLTGEMRFIDLDKDLVDPVTEYDTITVVNYPASAPSDDVRNGDLNQKSYGLSVSQWGAIRDDLRDSILSAAARGVNLWIPEPQMAEHLGFIQGYDIHTTGNWQAPIGIMSPRISAEEGPNYGAKIVDDAHFSDPASSNNFQVGFQGDYSATWQANYYRRVVSTEPGLTDIPAYEMGDRIYRYMYNRFDGYADVTAYDILDRTGGLHIGDRVAMHMYDSMSMPVILPELLYGVIGAPRRSIVSARPEGIIGKVITREMETYYGPRGTMVNNPYENNAITIVAERGTVVRGVNLQGRVFMEFMDPQTELKEYSIDRYPDMWLGIRGRNISNWSLDTRRNGPFNGNVTGGTWVPVVDKVPAISMNGRGLKWLAAASEIPDGEARVYAPSVTSDVKAGAAQITKIRNISVSANPAESDVEVREPFIDGRPDVLVRAKPATSEVIMNGTGANIKATPAIIETVAPSAAIEADREVIYVYLDSSRNITLFLKED